MPQAWSMSSREYFNPRSREGSDEGGQAGRPRPAISIHAPVKGATYGVACRSQSARNFNPRSREGSDTKLDTSTLPKKVFQSTLP